MKSIVLQIVIAIVLVGLGVGAGYLSKRPARAGADAHADQQVVFDDRSLRNLGIELGEARLRGFVSHREVQAMIADAPLNERPLAAPLAGVVQSIAVLPGGVVKRGEPVVTVVRDAIPRPRLELTGGVFTPVSEALHEAFSSLRSAAKEVQIAEQELARVRRINAGSTGAPVIPKQTEIDLGYRLDAARQNIANARSELRHHGLSDQEIDAVIGGEHPPRGRDLWQRALTIHGLWTAEARGLFEALPAVTRSQPWSIATLGELSAAGVVDGALVAAVKASAPMRDNFGVVAGLLQQGQTVARLHWLAEQGALASVFPLRAPTDGPADWDVAQIAVQPGQAVAAGQTVAVLRDARTMWLRIKPVGDEVALVMAALRDRTRLHARPLVPGIGPLLEDLLIVQVTSGAEGGGDLAVLHCRNIEAKSSDPRFRSWQLRAGMRYAVHVPGQSYDQVFVFGKDAVAKEGSNRVVFLRDGDSFRPRTVRVLYEDDQNVLVANDGALFPEDVVVTSGAFVVAIAMQQGQGGGGHGHTH